MQIKHAAIAGMCIGMLAGIAICTIIGASLSDALFRIFILAVGGAWMGMLLAWLDDLLAPEHDVDINHQHRGQGL